MLIVSCFAETAIFAADGDSVASSCDNAPDSRGEMAGAKHVCAAAVLNKVPMIGVVVLFV